MSVCEVFHRMNAKGQPDGRVNNAKKRTAAQVTAAAKKAETRKAAGKKRNRPVETQPRRKSAKKAEPVPQEFVFVNETFPRTVDAYEASQPDESYPDPAKCCTAADLEHFLSHRELWPGILIQARADAKAEAEAWRNFTKTAAVLLPVAILPVAAPAAGSLRMHGPAISVTHQAKHLRLRAIALQSQPQRLAVLAALVPYKRVNPVC
jgi:hypothetical protein